jgi:hypothetical protein
MSAHSATIHPDEKYKLGKTARKVFAFGVLAGLALLVVARLLESSAKDHLGHPGGGWSRFLYAYIVGWSWILTLAIGGLLYVLIHHAVGAKWSVTTRRLAEILTGTFPFIGLLGLVFIIPMLAGSHNVYYWAHPDAHFGTWGKHGWLSPGFFAARYVGYFAVWIIISKYFESRSRKQDETGDPKLSARMRFVAGPGIVVTGLVVNYAAYDLLMSTAPHWYSTIFGVNIFGGSMLAVYAGLALFAMVLQRSGYLTHSVTTEHYHDLGKMTFAFTFFWTYTAFSQFMLIWYGNVPDETVFYNYRMFGHWAGWSWALLICQFAFPFVMLLSRWTKRILPIFAFFIVWQLVFHWVDMYWNVMPHYHWGSVVHGGALKVTGPLTGPVSNDAVDFNVGDVVTWFGLIALFIGAIGRGMKGNLIPVKDPNLGASLAHENY